MAILHWFYVYIAFPLSLKVMLPKQKVDIIVISKDNYTVEYTTALLHNNNNNKQTNKQTKNVNILHLL